MTDFKDHPVPTSKETAVTITKDEFFKAGRSSAAEKAMSIDHAARQIIATEAAQRVSKTERLRLLREARETADAAAESAAAPKPRKSAAKRAK
jgi:hypothetical protein